MVHLVFQPTFRTLVCYMSPETFKVTLVKYNKEDMQLPTTRLSLLLFLLKLLTTQTSKFRQRIRLSWNMDDFFFDLE